MALIGRQLVDQYSINSSGTKTYGLTWLPTDYTTATTTKYPLIIFLHGGGETGTGTTGLNKLISTALPQKIAQGHNIEASGKKFIVVSPQAPSGSYFHTQVEFILADVIARYRVDVSQIYVTGLSYGGGGTWRCVTNGSPLADKFAAILPISAIEVETAQEDAEMKNITKVHNVKVWGIVGQDDALIDVTKRYIDKVNSTSPSPLAKFTAIQGAGHSGSTWNTLYDPSWKVDGLNVYEWMLQYSRGAQSSTTTTSTKAGTSTSTTSSSTTSTTTKATSTTTTTTVKPASTTTTTTKVSTGVRRNIVPGVEGGKVIDGNAGFVYSPGDTLVLNSSYTWTYLSINNIHGTANAPITIVNEGGQVQMSAGIQMLNCTYIKAVFNGTTDIYGLRINSPTRSSWAIAIQGKSAHMEVSNVHIEPADYGFLIKNEADCDTTVNDWVMDDFYIHDNYIKNTGSQGMYIGSTDPSNTARPIICNGVVQYYAPSRLGNFRIMNNIILDTGRPGIQVSGAQFGINEIGFNNISNVGLQLDDAQGAGIILGGYTRAYVHNNTIKNTYTWGIASFGSGLSRIENNSIDSTGSNSLGVLPWGSGILLDTRKTVPRDLVGFSIKNNTLSHIAQSVHIEIGQLVPNYAPGNVICNNTTDGLPSVISVDAGIDWSTDCGVVPPTPSNPTTTTTSTTKAPSTTTTTTKVGSTTTTTTSSTVNVVLDITINNAHYTLYNNNTWK